jgi:hypothetical protein
MAAVPASSDKAVVSLTLLDCYSFRCMMDVLKGFRDNIRIQFKPKTVSIIETGSGETAIQNYEFNADDLLAYDFPFKDEKGEPWPLIVLETKASEFFKTLKSDSKKEHCIIYAEIDKSNLSCQVFILIRKIPGSIDLVNQIDTTWACTIPPNNFIDFYETHYKFREPNSKIPTGALAKVIQNFKARRFNRVVFELSDVGSITVRGKVDQKFKSGCILPKAGLDVINEPSEEREPEEPASFSCGGNVFEIETTYWSIDINMASAEWLIKIARFSQNSVLKIYLSHGLPLVLRTNLGSYGTATFSLASTP